MLPTIILSTIFSFPDNSFTLGEIETIAEGFQFTEGPIWSKKDGLVFSDIPGDTIYQSDKSIFRRPSGKSNGLTRDRQGRLLACEHWNRRVTRTEKDGSITVLADSYMGKKLNSPNDIVVRSDGVIFFTDPPYGLEGRPAELPFAGVYALFPDGVLKLLSVYFQHPNGLVFSPDEKTLYVGDSEAGFIQTFEVAADGTLSNTHFFCSIPTPDGMKVDVQGNLWTTSTKGICIYTPSAELKQIISFPHAPANCCFGGEDGKTLYVTAVSGVYKISTTVKGILPE